jgi:hypothetical protein
MFGRIFRSFIKSSVASDKRTEGVDVHAHLADAERKRAVLDWRDRHELRVESVLRLNLPELKDRLSQIVESVSAKEFVFSFATWPKKRLDPSLRNGSSDRRWTSWPKLRRKVSRCLHHMVAH